MVRAAGICMLFCVGFFALPTPKGLGGGLGEPVVTAEPCPTGEAFRAEQPDFMSEEDWEFMLAYGCGTLEMFAAGEFPGGAEVRKAPVTGFPSEPGYAAPVTDHTGVAGGLNESAVPALGWDLTSTVSDERILYDPNAEPPAPPALSLPVAPEAANEGDSELLALQEDFVAKGCAHDVVPKKCLKHPYYLMVLEETGEEGWSEAP